MDCSTLYYNALSESAKRVYLLYERYFEHNGLFPCQFKINFNPSDEDLCNSYSALYLDKIFLQMIPPKFLRYSVRQKNVGSYEVELFSDRFLDYTLREIKETEKIIAKKRKDFLSLRTADVEQRKLVTGICEFLYETSCYRIRPDGKGESPIDILLHHSGHCVGFSRTIKLFFPECKIERCYIKHEFSLVKDSSNPSKNVGHMLCSVLSKDKEKIYFDPTTSVNIADSVIKRELDNSYYRQTYGEHNFFPPEFMDKNALLRKHILEDEK